MIEIERKYRIPPSSLTALEAVPVRIVQLYTTDGPRIRHEAVRSGGFNTYVTVKSLIAEGMFSEDENRVDIDLVGDFDSFGITNGLIKIRQEVKSKVESSMDVKLVFDYVGGDQAFLEIETVVHQDELKTLTPEVFLDHCNVKYLPEAAALLGIETSQIIDVTTDRSYSMRSLARPIDKNWLEEALQEQLRFVSDTEKPVYSLYDGQGHNTST